MPLWLARLSKHWRHALQVAAAFAIGAIWATAYGSLALGMTVGTIMATGVLLFGWKGAPGRPLPPTTIEQWLASPWPTETEPVDACEHTGPAVPVEADVTGDGEDEVVGWLCEECGAKVSIHAAARRNGLLPEPETGDAFGLRPYGDVPLRQTRREEALTIEAARSILAQIQQKMAALIAHFDTGGGSDGYFIISTEEHRAYTALADEAIAMREYIKRAEAQIEARRTAGIKCPGYIEQRQVGGAVTRQYPLPGECLCGDCSVEAVHGWDGSVVRRIVTSGTIRTGGGLVLDADGFATLDTPENPGVVQER